MRLERFGLLFLVGLTACPQDTQRLEDSGPSADVDGGFVASDSGMQADAAEHLDAASPLDTGPRDVGPPLEPDDLERAAVILGSCLPDDGVNRILSSAYREILPQAYRMFTGREILACLVGKQNGCTAVEECTGARVSVDTGSCIEGCTGSVLEGCGDGLQYIVDCSVLGNECFADEGRCRSTRTASASCDADYDAACVGGRPTFCDNYGLVQAGERCSDYGLTCALRVGERTTAACQGIGPQCEPLGFSADGLYFLGSLGCGSATDLLTCVGEGTHRIDCGTIGRGFTCQRIEGFFGPDYQCGLGDDCNPLAAASCDGNTLVVCNAGRIDRVDCTDLGFTGCNARFGVCSPSPYPL